MSLPWWEMLPKANIGAISYARSIGDKVIAMHVSTKDTENKDKEIEQEFKNISQKSRWFISDHLTAQLHSQLFNM